MNQESCIKKIHVMLCMATDRVGLEPLERPLRQCDVTVLAQGGIPSADDLLEVLQKHPMLQPAFKMADDYGTQYRLEQTGDTYMFSIVYPAVETIAIIGSLHKRLTGLIQHPMRPEKLRFFDVTEIFRNSGCTVTPESLVNLINGEDFKSLRQIIRENSHKMVVFQPVAAPGCAYLAVTKTGSICDEHLDSQFDAHMRMFGILGD